MTDAQFDSWWYHQFNPPPWSDVYMDYHAFIPAVLGVWLITWLINQMPAVQEEKPKKEKRKPKP